MNDTLPQPSQEQQPPQQVPELPEAITSVDQQISKEFAAMHPFVSPPPKRSGLPNFVGYIGDGFRYHKVIAFPILIGFILIAGTVTTLALSGGGSKKDVALTDTTSGQGSTGTSTRSGSDTSDSDGTSEDTSSDNEDGSLTTDDLTDVEYDPAFDLLGEDEGSDFTYEPDEEVDLGGPVEDPSVPTDPGDTTPPIIPDTPGTDTPQPVLASFASYNYASWKPASGIAAAIQSLSAKADAVGLQEFGPSSHRDALSKAIRDCASCNYALYMPSTSNGGSTPIIWKKDKFQLLSKGNVKVYDGQTVETAGGSNRANAKYIVWVRLKHIASGRVLYFVNTQLISSVEKNGAPDRSVPKRLALYDKHISALASKVNQLQQNDTPVFATGDFNVDFYKDRQVHNALFPYAKMNSVNTWANWRYIGAPDGGSYNGRLIDYVFANRTDKVVPQSAQLLPNYGSDHRAVRMVTQLK